MQITGWISICVVCFAAGVTDAARPVTNEDIRDAILSVVHMIRNTEDKLERHEYRERALGDQVKKALATIDKRQKLMEPIKGTLGRLDERLATVETILMQKEERQQKTSDALDEIQKKIPELLDKFKADIIAQLKPQPQPPKNSSNPPAIAQAQLDQLQKDIAKRMEDTSKATVKQLQDEFGKIQAANTGQRKIDQDVTDHLALVQNHFNNTDQLLQKYENKLAEYHNRVEPRPDPAKDVVANQLQTNLLQAIDTQRGHVEQILADVKTVTAKIDHLPNASALEQLSNATLDSLATIKEATLVRSDRVIAQLEDKVKMLDNNNAGRHAEVKKSIGELNEMTDRLNGNVVSGYDQLKENIQGLAKLEQVMVQTADGVLDTKRRVEYGVHQILLEMGELIKSQNKEINTAIADRFDLFEMNVLDEETGALTNITAKIGHEIDQVWRQIGIMHQQMSASGDTLNKLQSQTDSYVNGSLNTMDTMKGKVGQITSRMSEVDDNLNYLLGRLSLVTQEFNQIKNGLGKALDEIKGSFQAVQQKIEDKGPGPHQIPSSAAADIND